MIPVIIKWQIIAEFTKFRKGGDGMKKAHLMKKSVLLTGLLVVMAAPVYAAEANTNMASGFYATASVGQTRIDDKGLDDLGNMGISVDDTDTGYSIGLGYEFNKYVALEAGYANLGEASASYADSRGSANASVEADGYYLGPKLTLPVTDKFAIFGKMGLFVWKADGRASGTGAFASPTVSASDDGTDLYFGVGMGYDVTDTLSVKAEWTRFRFDGGESSDTDVDFISAGLVFKFGKLL